MRNISEVCVDLGSFGDMLGNLSPTFGLKANSGYTPATAPIEVTEAPISDKMQHVVDELAKLGNTLATLKPQDVLLWGL